MAAQALQDPTHHEPRLTIHEDAPAGHRARLSGVSPRRGAPAAPTPPPAIGKAAIFAAVRPGVRRCRGQREWLRAALGEIEAARFYANRAAHYAGICRVLMKHMDWADRTSRPGHLGIAAAVGVSADTVGRAVAWLQERGLLGLVSPGTRGPGSPGEISNGFP